MLHETHRPANANGQVHHVTGALAATVAVPPEQRLLNCMTMSLLMHDASVATALINLRDAVPLFVIQVRNKSVCVRWRAHASPCTRFQGACCA